MTNYCVLWLLCFYIGSHCSQYGADWEKYLFRDFNIIYSAWNYYDIVIFAMISQLLKWHLSWWPMMVLVAKDCVLPAKRDVVLRSGSTSVLLPMTKASLDTYSGGEHHVWFHASLILLCSSAIQRVQELFLYCQVYMLIATGAVLAGLLCSAWPVVQQSWAEWRTASSSHTAAILSERYKNTEGWFVFVFLVWPVTSLHLLTEMILQITLCYCIH